MLALTDKHFTWGQIAELTGSCKTLPNTGFWDAFIWCVVNTGSLLTSVKRSEALLQHSQLAFLQTFWVSGLASREHLPLSWPSVVTHCTVLSITPSPQFAEHWSNKTRKETKEERNSEDKTVGYKKDTIQALHLLCLKISYKITLLLLSDKCSTVKNCNTSFYNPEK